MNTQSIFILLIFLSSSLKSANKATFQDGGESFSLTKASAKDVQDDKFTKTLTRLLGEDDAAQFKKIVRQNPGHMYWDENELARTTSIQGLLMYVAGYLADVRATQLLLDHDPLIDVNLTDYCEGFNRLPAFMDYRIKRINELSDFYDKQFGTSTDNSTGKPNEMPISDEDKIVKGLNSMIMKNKEKNTRALQEYLPQLNRNLVSIICDYGWQGENDYQYHYDQLEKGFNYLTVYRMIEKKRMEQREKNDQARRSLALLYSHDLPDA